MNKFVDSVKKSLIEALKELKIMSVLKIYVAIAIIICAVYGVYNTFLHIDYYEIKNIEQVLGMAVWPAILIFLIHYLILFEVSRKTEKRRFEVMKYIKFIAMFVIIIVTMFVIIIVIYLGLSYAASVLSPIDIHVDDNPDNGLYVSNNLRTYLDNSYLVHIYTILKYIGFFVFLMLFYAPFIQYVEKRGFWYSLKKSVLVFIKKPADVTGSIIISFVLFAIPSIIFILPFTFTLSPVVVLYSAYPPLFVPLTMIPAIFGMTLGTILMYSFIAKYCENEIAKN